MSEKQIISQESTISYEGYFDPNELFLTIENWLKENHYDQVEKETFERAIDSKRFLQYNYQPFKKLNDYAKFIIKLKIKISDLEDTLVEYNNKKIPLSKGKVKISLSGLLETDYENTWETKPIYFFLKTIFNKFILKMENNLAKGKLNYELNQLKGEIKNYFNMYKKY